MTPQEYINARRAELPQIIERINNALAKGRLTKIGLFAGEAPIWSCLMSDLDKHYTALGWRLKFKRESISPELMTIDFYYENPTQP